jgi:hypothetical protein
MGRAASSVEEGASQFDVPAATVCVSSDRKATAKGASESYEDNFKQFAS